jgi:membrane protease YdiL (CAAX protease family)
MRLDAVPTGVAGGLLLCLPVALAHILGHRPLHGTAGLLPWALVVTVVATAEEFFLRGTLYDEVNAFAGPFWAAGAGAVVFALLHVPMYGWHVLPLDLAVGVVLGMLRNRTGSVIAPATAHLVADYVGWFLQ